MSDIDSVFKIHSARFDFAVAEVTSMATNLALKELRMKKISEMIERVREKNRTLGCTNRCKVKLQKKGGIVTNGICDCVQRIDENVNKRIAVELKLSLCDALVDEWERCEQEAAEYATEVHDSSRGQY